MRKPPTVYKPRALVDGAVIGQDPASRWIAIPDKFAGRKFTVEYFGMVMTIKDWKTDAQLFKRFRDKYWTATNGRQQHYTLGYFKFVPDGEEEQPITEEVAPEVDDTPETLSLF